MSVTKRQVALVFNELHKTLSEDQDAQAALTLLEERVESLGLFKEQKKSSLDRDFPLPQELIDCPDGYAVFSDGACRGNPGPGAWGIICMNGKGEVLFESNGLDLTTTNNRMELEGAIQSLERLIDFWNERNLPQAPTYLFSDSKYVIEGISKWVPGWKAKGWKKSDGKTPENLELWQHLDFVIAKFTKLEFRWVRGHAGHPQNEHCDRLANEALDQSGF